MTVNIFFNKTSVSVNENSLNVPRVGNFIQDYFNNYRFEKNSKITKTHNLSDNELCVYTEDSVYVLEYIM